MNATLARFAPVLGRVLLSAIFLISGFGKIMDWSGTAGYMASHGMPAVPFLLFMAIVLELGGGLSILLGFQARWGALALVVFLIPATLIFHAFWSADPEQAQMQTISFLKNTAILGGLLTVMAHGSGPFSLSGKSKTHS
ncbi:MAG: DoxX family protein [Candidatus Hydrogenedentes bacterium]|nr:DoxX family protein [Candidatus Hydrogenedentota bacterium]